MSICFHFKTHIYDTAFVFVYCGYWICTIYLFKTRRIVANIHTHIHECIKWNWSKYKIQKYIHRLTNGFEYVRCYRRCVYAIRNTHTSKMLYIFVNQTMLIELFWWKIKPLVPLSPRILSTIQTHIYNIYIFAIIESIPLRAISNYTLLTRFYIISDIFFLLPHSQSYLIQDERNRKKRTVYTPSKSFYVEL